MNKTTRIIGLAVWLLSFGRLDAAAQENTEPAGDEKVKALEHELETRYQDFFDQPAISTNGWIRIGEWCLNAAEQLPEERRALFLKRGRDAAHKALELTRLDVEQAVTGGIIDIKKAPSYSEALAARNTVEKNLQEILGELSAAFNDADLKKEINAIPEAELRKLDALLAPMQKREFQEKVNAGYIHFEQKDGKAGWVPFTEPSGQYQGLKKLDAVLEAPEKFAGRTLGIEMSTRGAVYDLIGLKVLDGFDAQGDYVIPNFMEGRLAIVLSPENPGLARALASLKQPAAEPASEAAAPPPYIFRMVVEVSKREMQSTVFFAGEVRQLFIHNAARQLMIYIGPRGEEVRGTHP